MSGTLTAAQIAAMWRNDAKAERAKVTGAEPQGSRFAKLARADALEKCARELELHLEPQAAELDDELRAERAAELRLFREGRL